MSTAALTGGAPATPAAPAASTAPPAAPPGGAIAHDAEAPGEVLTVAELLRLLEQGEGFGQTLARAAATPGTAPAAPAGSARQKDTDDADGDDAEAPCDIATLLRLLEQPPAPAAMATAASALAADALARGAASATDPVATGGASDAARAPRPSASAGGVPGAHGGSAATPAAAAAADAANNLLEAAIAGMTDAAGSAGREAVREHAPPPTATAARVADPAQATLDIVQGLRPAFADAPLERAVRVPVRDPAWPQAVAAEIRFLADQKVEAATLRLSPEHLGPLEVRIDVRDGNVSVAFGVAHADTQAALQEALPRLREMLAAAGLQLGQASVQQETRHGSHNGGRAPAGGATPADNGAGAAPAVVRALGLVDDYA
ncbi:MAG: flagellar hook-length control protein FliK [Steroidobacteraceae bacterium]